MVRITNKPTTPRSASATCLLRFSSPATHSSLIHSTLRKGDALAVSRIAGLQATKLTPQLIPLAHPALQITGAEVEIELFPPATASAENTTTVNGGGGSGGGSITTTGNDASSNGNASTASPAAATTTTTTTTTDSTPQPSYAHGAALITSTVHCSGQTGVEMEALVGASVAGLALYDMLKGVDKGMVLEECRVIRKTGGKSGGWRWDARRGEIVRDG
jgi:molybdenum cofactor biosynthesis enzyme